MFIPSLSDCTWCPLFYSTTLPHFFIVFNLSCPTVSSVKGNFIHIVWLNDPWLCNSGGYVQAPTPATMTDWDPLPRIFGSICGSRPLWRHKVLFSKTAHLGATWFLLVQKVEEDEQLLCKMGEISNTYVQNSTCNIHIPIIDIFTDYLNHMTIILQSYTTSSVVYALWNNRSQGVWVLQSILNKAVADTKWQSKWAVKSPSRGSWTYQQPFSYLTSQQLRLSSR